MNPFEQNYRDPLDKLGDSLSSHALQMIKVNSTAYKIGALEAEIAAIIIPEETPVEKKVRQLKLARTRKKIAMANAKRKIDRLGELLRKY